MPPWRRAPGSTTSRAGWWGSWWATRWRSCRRWSPRTRSSAGLAAGAAAALGLAAGTPVVIGAADRPSEVLGTGATEACPMVGWGTTANVSVPVSARPAPPPPGVSWRRGRPRVGGFWRAACRRRGRSCAWLGQLAGHPPAELAALAGQSPPGARGVLATPWLDGARAPWWRPGAGAALVGLGSAHGPAELARAGFESVAWEVTRCLEAIASRRPPGPPVEELALGGRGAAIPVWLDVLGGITGLPVRRRRSGQAASAGAALLAAHAVGIECDLELIDPVDSRVEPDPAAAGLYVGLRRQAERVAEAVIELASTPLSPGPRPTAAPGGPGAPDPGLRHGRPGCRGAR